MKCEKDANVTGGTKCEGHLNVFIEVKQILRQSRIAGSPGT